MVFCTHLLYSGNAEAALIFVIGFCFTVFRNIGLFNMDIIAFDIGILSGKVGYMPEWILFIGNDQACNIGSCKIWMQVNYFN